MSKHIVKGFITYTKPSYQTKPTISWATYKPSPEYWPDSVVVCEHAIEVEVPDDFNPIAPMVSQLEEQKRQIRLRMGAELKAIDKKISELQCIEHTPTVAA